MKQITIPRRFDAMQVEVPESYKVDDKRIEVKRSCKGALHLRPASTKVITDEEYAFLEKEHPAICKRLRVLLVAVSPKAATKKPAVDAKAAAKKTSKPSK